MFYLQVRSAESSDRRCGPASRTKSCALQQRQMPRGSWTITPDKGSNSPVQSARPSTAQVSVHPASQRRRIPVLPKSMSFLGSSPYAPDN
jgi:hypothetical protein